MMDNTVIIGVDHGWSQMKTAEAVFSSGVEEILSEPAFFDDVLEYGGKYYKVGTKRDAVMENKTVNDDYYLLTLASMAKEMKKRSWNSPLSFGFESTVASTPILTSITVSPTFTLLGGVESFSSSLF